MIQILDLIDIAHVSHSPIYIFLCTVLVTLPRLGQISYHFDDSRTLQYTPIGYLYARWSTFSDRFHNVSFTMQSHDQNSTLSLMFCFHLFFILFFSFLFPPPFLQKKQKKQTYLHVCCSLFSFQCYFFKILYCVILCFFSCIIIFLRVIH